MYCRKYVVPVEVPVHICTYSDTVLDAFIAYMYERIWQFYIHLITSTDA